MDLLDENFLNSAKFHFIDSLIGHHDVKYHIRIHWLMNMITTLVDIEFKDA